MFLITSDNIKIYYDSFGIGQPIAFLPGFNESREIWYMQTELLKKVSSPTE